MSKSTETSKEAQLRWYLSEKGKEFRERQTNKRHAMEQLEKWLEENPGKTMEDFLKTLPKPKKAKKEKNV
jgi:cytochrome c553